MSQVKSNKVFYLLLTISPSMPKLPPFSFTPLILTPPKVCYFTPTLMPQIIEENMI